MHGNEELTRVFEDTRHMYENEPVLVRSVKESISGTRLYMEGEYPNVEPNSEEIGTKITVTPYRSLQAAVKLMEEYKGKRVAVHNFASAANPGGGVENGARAQEECLCRCTTLYPVLKTDELWKSFYSFHRERHDQRYTDACIYSPDITIIKTDTDMPERLPESEWRRVDIMTCAAPDLHAGSYTGSGEPVGMSDTELMDLHKKRAAHMLAIAAANGAEILVLGAFGCGAFANDPKIVARAYKETLEAFDKYRFTHIEFAVFCGKWDSANYDTFKHVFAK